VIGAVVFLDLFECHDGLGVFNDTNDLTISFFIRADRAKRLITEIAANLTGSYVLFGVDNGTSEGFDVLFTHSENGKGVSDGGFSADTGKTAKFLDQLL
jgi:hypothetical protein